MNKFRPKFYYAGAKTHRAGRVKNRQDLAKTKEQGGELTSSESAGSFLERRSSVKNFNVGQTLGRVAKNELSERDNLKRLRLRRKKISRLLRYSLIGLLLVAVFLRFLIFKVDARVAHQTITAPNLEQYQTEIEAYLNKQPFERLSFNIDKAHLERYIQNKHPEIKQIKAITSGFLQPTVFELELRQPVATMLLNQKRYFVDAAGVPFVDNYLTLPTIEIIDQSGIRESGEFNQRIISGRFLRFIGRAIALTQEKGYQIVSAAVPAGTIHQVEFKIDGFSLFVKMTIDREVVEQVEDLTRSLVYIKQSGFSPQYLDVRTANKVFYK